MHEIFNLEKIYRAYLDCRENKRKTINALKFEQNLEENLFLLKEDLLTKNYRPGRSICFVVTKPKPREIFAASFRDRIVHHLLVREVGKIGERALIYDTFSCRKNKGTHLAVDRLKKFILKESQNGKRQTYYAQLDIEGFFMSINHDILYSLFEKLISKKNKSERWQRDILWLARMIIYHKPTQDYIIKGSKDLFSLIPPQKSLFHSKDKNGLPIGNYSSQFLANLYLNELDQFVKRKLKAKGYVRYVDDFILLNQDRNKLKQWHQEIDDFLIKELNLKLNHAKTKIQSTQKGIDFLGYFIKPDYVLVRRRVVRRAKDRIRAMRLNDQSSKLILSSVNSYFGHFQHAYSFHLRQCFIQKINKLEKETFI